MNFPQPTAQQRLWSLIILSAVLVFCLGMLVVIAILKDGQATDIVVNTLQTTINTLIYGVAALAGIQLVVNGVVQTIATHSQAQVAQTVATASGGTQPIVTTTPTTPTTMPTTETAAPAAGS